MDCLPSSRMMFCLCRRWGHVKSMAPTSSSRVFTGPTPVEYTVWDKDKDHSGYIYKFKEIEIPWKGKKKLQTGSGFERDRCGERLWWYFSEFAMYIYCLLISLWWGDREDEIDNIQHKTKRDKIKIKAIRNKTLKSVSIQKTYKKMWSEQTAHTELSTRISNGIYLLLRY